MFYFDYAATTKMSEEALQVYIKANRDFFGNSSSLHNEGGRAQFILEQCRDSLAQLTGAKPEGIYFTSGGTESNILAICSLARSAKKRGSHLITSQAEHSSVHSAMAYLEKEGFQITKLPLNAQGVIDLHELAATIRPDTVLVSLQYINQEIGTVQPIQKIGPLLKEKGILLHSDCVQAFGKIDLRPIMKWVDSFSVTSHKLFGPKGTGAVYIHPCTRWQPLFPGLTHEKGLRGGTVNVPAIAAFTAAAEAACRSFSLDKEWSLRRRLKKQLTGSPFEWIEADDEQQLPSIIGMKRNGMEGQLVMLKLNEQGFAISTGSACDSRSENGTKAIMAMGCSLEEAKQFFRISFGRFTTHEEMEKLGDGLLQLCGMATC
ncbi:IscS subfamily cysteine desulfurase [Bacillus thermotolerans]|uniref:Cysteine desulfurase n=1 Tax=Bacillus thermotolerans TaxID=1221996 RepID=A0A0F5ID29_BACTR|nr:IscS subfamily cysteine desulfurase [Bacillus thermotolerans]KKB43421.1 Cysteine desulfurase [Bacillus thermotolerans]